MAQLKLRIAEGGSGIREGARLAPGGGQVAVGANLPGPAQVAMRSPDKAAAPWERVRKGAATVQDWALASLQADAATEATKAKSSAILRLADAQAEVTGDRSITNGQALGEAWVARTTAIGEEIGQGLSRRARQSFDRDFGEMAASRLLNVRADFATRQSQGVLASLKELSITSGNAAASAGNPALRQNTINSFNADVAAHLAAGSINPTQASALRMGFLSDIDEARVRTAISSNPTAAIALINNSAETPNIPADRRASLLSSAVAAQQARAAQGVAEEMRNLTLGAARERAQDRTEQRSADEAEKAFRDALRTGDVARIEGALGTLRRVGRPGAYASAHDAYMGVREVPTTPQMRTWLADRQDGRGGTALTRTELENARAGGGINDTVYREGIDFLRNRESANYRQAEDFLDNALGTPSPTIADRDLQPWQRQARAQRGAILNDLRLELRRNPDADPLGFVQDRIRSAPDPAREVERARARQALITTVPEAARSPEGIAELRSQLSAYQAYRNASWFVRQGMATVPAPTVDVLGRTRPVTADDIARWQSIVEKAQ